MEKLWPNGLNADEVEDLFTKSNSNCNNPACSCEWSMINRLLELYVEKQRPAKAYKRN